MSSITDLKIYNSTSLPQLSTNETWVSSDGITVTPDEISHPFQFTFLVNASDILTSYNLITIPNNWQQNNTNLKLASIGNSVTSIGNFAFEGCDALTSITIPNSVTTIGDNTFQYCSYLPSITIPNSVTTIGSTAFDYSGLTSISLPNSVTTIGSYAFSYCGGLTLVNIPSSVTSFGSNSFQYCTSLTSVNLRCASTALNNFLGGSFITTIHALTSDASWTAGAGQTIGGKVGITVIKDLV